MKNQFEKEGILKFKRKNHAADVSRAFSKLILLLGFLSHGNSFQNGLKKFHTKNSFPGRGCAGARAINSKIINYFRVIYYLLFIIYSYLLFYYYYYLFIIYYFIYCLFYLLLFLLFYLLFIIFYLFNYYYSILFIIVLFIYYCFIYLLLF